MSLINQIGDQAKEKAVNKSIILAILKKLPPEFLIQPSDLKKTPAWYKLENLTKEVNPSSSLKTQTQV